jgi:hypothetical protein
MSYETISLRIKEIMDRVDGIYNVHTYLRDIPDEADFEAAFSVKTLDENIVTAWMMTRLSVAAEQPTIDTAQIYDVTHRMEIQGFYGLSDAQASEKSFQDIIDNLLNKFRMKFCLEDETTGAQLSGLLVVEPLQITEIGHGQFSNYFVHFCRMLLSVKERLQ